MPQHKMSKNKFSREKFESTFLHILSKCGNLPNVGKTILYKLLYFCDFDFYEINETSITGEAYVKLPMGPAPSHFKSVTDGLKKKKKIKEVRADFHGKKQTRFILLDTPDVSPLSGKEVEMINSVVQRLSSMNASQMSKYSHGDIPWRATKDGERINYDLVFYREPPYSLTDTSRDSDNTLV